MQCKIKVTQEVKAMECENCSRLQCTTCAKIPDALYDNKEVLEMENLKFTCTPCLKPKKKNKAAQDSGKLDLVLQKLTKLDCIDHVLDKCNSLESKLSELDQNLERRIDDRVQTLVDAKIDETLHGQIAKEVRDCLEEQRDRELRAMNVIVYGIVEPQKETPGERKTTDLQLAQELSTELGVEASKVVRTVRIGKKETEGPRPWKIVLSDPAAQKEFLRNTWKLEKSKKFAKASVNPDMTKVQRSQRKQLVEELKARKNNGELNLAIRNDKVVTVLRRKKAGEQAASSNNEKEVTEGTSTELTADDSAFREDP